MPETLEIPSKSLAIRPKPLANGVEIALPRSQTVPLPKHIIAASEEMREIVSVVRAIAPTAITVLLIGESGTGKEVFAELIHDLSERKGPFVTVNCGAIPEGLIESELFGHEKGAFTGAIGQRKGFFEAAQDGTLLLDEIGEMPLGLQVKLLRALETGTFTRVGSTTLQKTNARIIAATNRDLELDVRAGTFRSDLYYRLRAVMLRIPPLRNRREDIPFLIETMLEEFVQKHHIGQMPELAPEAIELLINHEWRGNIRELRNTLEQLVVLVCAVPRNSDRCVISGHDVERALESSISGWDGQAFARPLPAPAGHRESPQTERELIYRALIELRTEMADIKELLKQRGWDSPRRATNLPALPVSTNGSQENPIKSLDELETNAIEQALEYYHGNRRHAAKALGLSERSLYRKLKEKGLE
ncbi:MAG TPA: sigma-54 dependent transcriptional regulator [Candidatus Kapabacteria bacterium]|nr:sigma-54 dependent transcriptional regulator [Candidatus Kapabacteria bacterium]